MGFVCVLLQGVEEMSVGLGVWCGWGFVVDRLCALMEMPGAVGLMGGGLRGTGDGRGRADMLGRGFRREERP